MGANRRGQSSTSTGYPLFCDLALPDVPLTGTSPYTVPEVTPCVVDSVRGSVNVDGRAQVRACPRTYVISMNSTLSRVRTWFAPPNVVRVWYGVHPATGGWECQVRAQVRAEPPQDRWHASLI